MVLVDDESDSLLSSSSDDDDEEERSFFDVSDVAAALGEDSSCRRLRKLTMFGCGLKSLKRVPLSPRLRSLTLSSNNLGPALASPELCSLSRLEVLDVSSNRLRKIGKAKFAKLARLSVAYNRLTTLDGLDAPLLEHVDARNNLIEETATKRSFVVLLEGNPVLRRTELVELRAKTKRLEDAFSSIDDRSWCRLKKVFCVLIALWTKAKIVRRFDRWRAMAAFSARLEVLSLVRRESEDEARREFRLESERLVYEERERGRAENERIAEEARKRIEAVAEDALADRRRLAIERDKALEAALEEQRESLLREHRESAEAERETSAKDHDRELRDLRGQLASALERVKEQQDRAKEQQETIESLEKDAASLRSRIDERDAAVASAHARDSSARMQLSELRAAFERAVVAAAEHKARSAAAESTRAEMAARLSEAADLTRTQQAALIQARKVRDECRRRLSKAEDGERRGKEERSALEKVAEDLRRELVAIGDSWREEKVQRAERERAERAAFEDRLAASLVPFAALQRDHRENARRVLIATEAAEAARDEAARQESLASDLGRQLDRADRECQDLVDEYSRLKSARDALSEDRNLLKSDLDKCEARLKAQLHIEQHLRSVVAELRQRSGTKPPSCSS